MFSNMNVKPNTNTNNSNFGGADFNMNKQT